MLTAAVSVANVFGGYWLQLGQSDALYSSAACERTTKEMVLVQYVLSLASPSSVEADARPTYEAKKGKTLCWNQLGARSVHFSRLTEKWVTFNFGILSTRKRYVIYDHRSPEKCLRTDTASIVSKKMRATFCTCQFERCVRLRGHSVHIRQNATGNRCRSHSIKTSYAFIV